MENYSQRYSNEDTTPSMYLSFDAESTMSTACYKTLDAMSDMENSKEQNKTLDNDINSTLEVNNISQNSYLKTVKKLENSDIKSNTPLRTLTKNVLKEYRAVCSTPSKEKLLKTVDVTRGSDATRCIDLGLAFLGIDDEKPAFFPPPYIGIHEENKENALPDIEEASTLSICSSAEMTSVIEKKMSVSTVGSITEKDCVSDLIVDKIAESCSFVNKEVKNLVESKTNDENEIDKGAKILKNINIVKSEEATSVVQDVEVDKMKKPKIAVLNRNSRLSVCEPNLQTGKPSRILNADNKRRSLLPTIKKPTSSEAEIEISLIMGKMLKITNANKTTEENVKLNDKVVHPAPKMNLPIDQKHSLMPTVNARKSLLPSAQGNKRPYSFAQRMSVVVKTTLNSPARKISRRSAFSGVMSALKRKSVTPQQGITATNTSNNKHREALNRKSMVLKPSFGYTNAKSNPKTLTTLHEKSTKTVNADSERKSIYPSLKVSEKDAVASIPQKNADISYACNICKDKFRIKSLLDAHKRSHETDSNLPAFIKKSLTIKQQPLSGTLLGNPNQCKYCDKKFALTRALHIHLLQNCPKIPPLEKRKLQYTDLNHVEKAQLPSVFPNPNLLKNVITKSSSELLNDKKDNVTSNLIATVTGDSSTASKITAPKVRKISAHSGVYRTPSKSIPCHLCKLTFKSLLDYTNHNLTSHSLNAKKN